MLYYIFYQFVTLLFAAHKMALCNSFNNGL